MTGVGKVSVILPCFNERGGIMQLITTIHETLHDYDHEVLLVDDNSPDGTYQFVADQNLPYVKAILRPSDPSLGKSIRTGLEQATGNVFVVMDSDFNHQPKDIPVLIDNLKYFECVCASRFVYGGDMGNKFRHLSSWIFNIFSRIMTRTDITDSLFGFWAAKRPVIESLDYDKVFYGYGDYCIRMMYYLQKNKTTILQIPGVLGRRIAGQGNTRLIRTLLKYSVAVMKLALQRDTPRV